MWLPGLSLKLRLIQYLAPDPVRGTSHLRADPSAQVVEVAGLQEEMHRLPQQQAVRPGEPSWAALAPRTDYQPGPVTRGRPQVEAPGPSTDAQGRGPDRGSKPWPVKDP